MKHNQVVEKAEALQLELQELLQHEEVKLNRKSQKFIDSPEGQSHLAEMRDLREAVRSMKDVMFHLEAVFEID